MQGRRGDVDVEQAAGRGLTSQQPVNHRRRKLGRPVVLKVVVPLKRHCDASNAEKGPLDRGGHRAGIEHIDAGVQAAVDAADHQVGPPRTELGDPQFDGVGRASIDGPAPAAVALKNLLGRQRGEKGDGVADPALLGGRGHHRRLQPSRQGPLDRSEAGGVHAVIIGQQGKHSGAPWGKLSFSASLYQQSIGGE